MAEENIRSLICGSLAIMVHSGTTNKKKQLICCVCKSLFQHEDAYISHFTSQHSQTPMKIRLSCTILSRSPSTDVTSFDFDIAPAKSSIPKTTPQIKAIPSVRPLPSTSTSIKNIIIKPEPVEGVIDEEDNVKLKAKSNTPRRTEQSSYRISDTIGLASGRSQRQRKKKVSLYPGEYGSDEEPTSKQGVKRKADESETLTCPGSAHDVDNDEIEDDEIDVPDTTETESNDKDYCPSSPIVTVKRGRGRPRKIPKIETSSEPISNIQQVEITPEITTTPRRRGRPRKFETLASHNIESTVLVSPASIVSGISTNENDPDKGPSDLNTTSSNNTPFKRGRGRPRKYPLGYTRTKGESQESNLSGSPGTPASNRGTPDNKLRSSSKAKVKKFPTGTM